MLIAGTKPGDRWYREGLLLTMRAEDPMHSDLSHARFAGNFLSTLFAIQVMKIEYRSLS